MKKTIYLFVAFLLCLTSCVEPLGPNDQLPLKAEETGLVAVTMQLTIPYAELSAGTKANTFSHLPQIESIHVAVFGTSGYPQAYSLAESVGSYASTNYDPEAPDQNIYEFKVLLPVYDGEAHVHIIANGPESIPFVEQNEYSIMSQMTTTNKVGAYWARVVLPNGILPTKDVNGIMETDEDGNFKPSEETIEKFRNLTLIRNFAQIKLIVDPSSGLSEVSWALVNDLQYGAVAPVNPDSVVIDGIKTPFVDNYKDYEFDSETGKMFFFPAGATDSTWYKGYSANNSVNGTVTDNMDFPATLQDSLWCYERPDPNKTNPTFILMKATFQGSVCYYRVDLTDENLGGYFPLYRNYKYQIKISHVGNKGDSSPSQAALHPSNGNMSMAAETKTLTDVSDGISRLYVEFVEKTYTTGGEKSFWVYYVPNVSDGTIDNTKIQVKVKDMGNHPALANATITKDDSKSLDTGEGAMHFYNFTLNGQDDDIDLASVIEVKADNGLTGVNHSTMYRDVTVRVMKKMNMSLSLNPNPIDEGIKKKTVLHIALSDTLQESMFPLEFYIEDSNRTLNPTGYDGAVDSITVPVKTGPSIYDATNKNSYYYIRTVSYSEYEPMLIEWRAKNAAHQPTTGIIDFTTEFKTIKEDSATTVYVDNEYFNMQSVDLTLPPTFKWVVNGAIPIPANASQRTVTVQLKSTATGEWELETSNGVSVSPTSGTGSQTITVTIPSNMDGSSSVERTVTAKLTGFEDQVLTINQNAKQTYSPSSAITTGSGNFGQTGVEYEDDYVTITFDGRNGNNATGYITLNRNNSNVTVTAKNAGARITRITVNFQNNYGPTNGATWTGSSNSATTSFTGHTYGNTTNRNYRATSITYTIEY